MKRNIVFNVAALLYIVLMNPCINAQNLSDANEECKNSAQLHCLLKSFYWLYYYCDTSVQPPIEDFRYDYSLTHGDLYQQPNKYEVEFADANNLFGLNPYFPIRLAIGADPVSGRNFLEELQLRSNCSTFDETVARNCIADAVQQLNSICPGTQNQLNRRIEIVDASSDPNGYINISYNDPEFVNSSGGAVAVALARQVYSFGPSPVPKAYISAKRRGSSPNILLNYTTGFRTGIPALEWSTSCPCNVRCDEQGRKCISFCRTILHELAHLYQVDHEYPGVPLSYDKYDILTSGKFPNETIVINQTYLEYDNKWCDNTLSDNDKCYICKRICVYESCSIADEIEVIGLNDPGTLSVQVSPNPADNTARITIESTHKSSIISGGIYSITGERILELPKKNADDGSVVYEIKVNDGRFVKGSYLMIISDGYDSSFKRFVVQ